MNKILIVVDMQNDFVSGSLGSEAAMAIVPNVVKKIDMFNGRYIICTADTHQEDYLSTQEGQKLPIEHCIVNTPGWDLVPEVNAALERKDPKVFVGVIEKTTFGAKDLPNVINNILYPDIDDKDMEIELVGLDTDICVISNALLLKAFFPEANIKIDSSCCAGTSEDAHVAALQIANSCQIRTF